MFPFPLCSQKHSAIEVWKWYHYSRNTTCIKGCQSYILTFSYTKPICSRRLWKFLHRNMKNLNEWKYNYWKKSWKHCCKRRNCWFWAVSPFVTMFLPVLCNRKCIYRKRLNDSDIVKIFVLNKLFTIRKFHFSYIEVKHHPTGNHEWKFCYRME